MAWYYNNIRIYVQSFESGEKYTIARLQPLGAKTILQGFGTESPVLKVGAKVVGKTNVDNLAACIGGGPYTLSGVQYSNANTYLNSFTYTRDMDYYQTIDPLQDCETPVYTVSLELYDDSP